MIYLTECSRETLAEPFVCTVGVSKACVFEDFPVGLSRKSLRHFYKQGTNSFPSSSWLWVLSAPNKEWLYLGIGRPAIFSEPQAGGDGQRSCVDWGPGQGVSGWKPPLGKEVDLPLSRTVSLDKGDLWCFDSSLNGSTERGGGEREGLPGYSWPTW